MIPINNHVLLKPVISSPERVKGSIILGVGKATKDQYLKNYVYRHLEVVAVPELKFPTTREEFSDSGYAFRYKTEMELKIGDIVWVKLRSAHGAKEVFVDGERLVLVHYADCYVAQRRNFHVNLANYKNIIIKDDVVWDVIPLNGNIICEKVYKKPTKWDFKPIEDVGKLKVKYVGNQSKSYFTMINGEFREIPLPIVKIKHKNIVQCDGPFLNLEGEYFHDFNGESQPVAIHHTNIAAIL